MMVKNVAEDDEESTDDAEPYDEAGEVYEERPHPARHKSARPGSCRICSAG